MDADDFRGQFDDHFEEALMDYDGSFETASSVAAVSLFDPTWSLQNRQLGLAWPLVKNERKKWRSRAEQYEHSITCRNSLFDCSPTLSTSIQFRMFSSWCGLAPSEPSKPSL